MKLLIVDANELVRHGVALVIRESIPGAETMEAGDPASALAIMRSDPADIVLVDVHPAEDADAAPGLELLGAIRTTWPRAPVLVLTSCTEGEYAREAMALGAAGYLLKDSTPADLVRAIRVALEGGSNILSTEIVTHLFDAPHDAVEPVAPVDTPGVHITRRETQILEGIVAGQSNREIAAVLGVSDKTVKSHLATLYRKMSVANRTQAAMAAMELGISAAAIVDAAAAVEHSARPSSD